MLNGLGVVFRRYRHLERDVVLRHDVATLALKNNYHLYQDIDRNLNNKNLLELVNIKFLSVLEKFIIIFSGYFML